LKGFTLLLKFLIARNSALLVVVDGTEKELGKRRL
jgi:hypothetical protein